MGRDQVSAGKLRIAAAIALFTVLASTGTIWLVHVARGGPAAQQPAATGGNALRPSVGDSGDPSPGPVHPAASASPSDPTRPAAPPVAPTGRPVVPRTTPGAATPSAAGSTAAASPSRSGPGPDEAPPVPVRGIRLGGVTLDDTSPVTPCLTVRNTRFSIPVQVVDLAVGNPNVVVDPEPCRVVDAGTLRAGPECRPGTVLEPGGGCWAGIGPAPAGGSGPQETTMDLRLRARCDSAAGEPCASSGKPAPSRQRPVDVEWVNASDVRLCYRVGLPADGIFC